LLIINKYLNRSDGWLSPRSRLGKDRNDFILIQLATPGKLSSIVIDTTGFDCNSPTAVFIQGCYSKDTDPQYDLYNSWIGMVSQSPILPGGLTRFDVSDVTDEIISHIRLYVMPDGGIQQVKVYGVPADKDRKKGRLLLEQAPQPKAINNTPHQLNQAIVDAMEEVLDDKPIIEHFNLLQTTRSSPTSSPAITEYASSSNSDSATIVTSSQEVKIEEIVIDTVDVLNVCSSSRDASPSSSLRKRKAASVEPSNDSPEEAPSTQSITKKLRGRPKKTAA
jgi:allantoicase